MNEIVLHSGAESEDIFFGQEPQITDWDEVYANVHKLDVNALISEIQRMEPLQSKDPRDHKVWVLQQKIRLALRHQAKKPNTKDTICPTCGEHKVDAIYHECLWCEEYTNQMGWRGGRGSCEFVEVCYDPKSHSWGLLYYWSHYDNTYIFWLAVGFKTWQKANLALYPFQLYSEWLSRKYKGLYSEYRMSQRLFGLSEMMERKDLPLYPEDFERETRERIREDMKDEHNLLSWYVDGAIRDYSRNQRTE